MTNINQLITEQTFLGQMDKTNTALAALLIAKQGRIQPTSWESTQRIIRDGLAKKAFAIRDQFTMQRANVNLTWDVIDIDHDTPTDPQFTHSMTLQLHDCFPTTMQFDAPEAFYYAENGLEAGTYHFTIDSTYDATYNDLTSYQFTLAQAVPAGGQLTFPWYANTYASTVKVNSFASAASTTAMEQVAVSEGTDGTNLGTLTAAGDFSNNLNCIHRFRYGSNNYKGSAIRQWLNSNKPAGQVWTPQTRFDRPPEWVSTADGFMYGMDADFLAAIGKTHIVAARNTVTDGGGYDEMDDYFFLPSRSEVYGGVEASGVNEGAAYPYYSHYSDLRDTAGTNSDTNRIKYKNGVAASWWCRTPLIGSAFDCRIVYNNGAIKHANIPSGNGIAPACNII